MDPADLYGLPLDRFVPERGALAKALRADRQREEAARVAALRKPSVAAWAVNQVMRTQGPGVKRLFDAGDALRAAQEDLLAGRGDARKLRAAGERERDAVDGLVDAARGLLTSEGHELSAAVVDRVADTLHAAALDEDAREQVREGRLERELRHVGFGLGEGAVAASPQTLRSKEDRPTASGKRAKGERQGAQRAKAKRGEERGAGKEGAQESRAKEKRAAAQRDRTAARRAARKAETAARRRVERAARALEEAQERHDRAARAFEKADAALASAREEAEAAVDEQRRAQANLEDAR